jgi:hypothetical protein
MLPLQKAGIISLGRVIVPGCPFSRFFALLDPEPASALASEKAASDHSAQTAANRSLKQGFIEHLASVLDDIHQRDAAVIECVQARLDHMPNITISDLAVRAWLHHLLRLRQGGASRLRSRHDMIYRVIPASLVRGGLDTLDQGVEFCMD